MLKRIVIGTKKYNSFFLGIIVFIAVCIIAAAVQATIIKTSLVSQLAKVTIAPGNVQDAYNNCVTNDGRLTVTPAIQAVKDNLEALIKENAVPYGMEDLKSMDDLKKGKKMKGMPSKEELNKMSDGDKIALAMKMQKQLGYGTGLQSQPSPKNTEAWGKCIKLNNEFIALASDKSIIDKLAALTEKSDAAHKKIDEETEASLKTCPILTVGESSGPDPKCIKAKKLAGIDKHISATNKYLTELRAILAWQTGRVKPLIVRADQLLNQVKFGDGLEDMQSKTIFNQLQGLGLQACMNIQAYAQAAYTKSAKWIVQKQRINEN